MGEILIGSPTPVPSPKGEGRLGLLLFVVWIHFEIVFLFLKAPPCGGGVGERLLLLFAESLIGGGIHQVAEFIFVREFHLDNPVGESVLVEEFGLVLQSFVDLYDGTADGRDEVAGSLDALDGAKLFACCDFVVHVGHVNIHHVAQSVLSIVGNTNVTKFAFYANVLV
jgi:hypothetical protein